MFEYEQVFVNAITPFINLKIDDSKLFFLTNTDKSLFNESLQVLRGAIQIVPVDFSRVYNGALQCLQALRSLKPETQLGGVSCANMREALSKAFEEYRKGASDALKVANDKVSHLEKKADNQAGDLAKERKELLEKNHQIQTLELKNTQVTEKNTFLEEQQRKLEKKLQELEAEQKKNKEELEKQRKEMDKLNDDLSMAQWSAREKGDELQQLKGQENIHRKQAALAYNLEEKIKIFNQFFIPLEYQSKIKFEDMSQDDMLQLLGFLKPSARAFEPQMGEVCQQIVKVKRLTLKRALEMDSSHTSAMFSPPPKQSKLEGPQIPRLEHSDLSAQASSFSLGSSSSSSSSSAPNSSLSSPSQ